MLSIHAARRNPEYPRPRMRQEMIVKDVACTSDQCTNQLGSEQTKPMSSNICSHTQVIDSRRILQKNQRFFSIICRVQEIICKLGAHVRRLDLCFLSLAVRFCMHACMRCHARRGFFLSLGCAYLGGCMGRAVGGFGGSVRIGSRVAAAEREWIGVELEMCGLVWNLIWKCGVCCVMQGRVQLCSFPWLSEQRCVCRSAVGHDVRHTG